MSELAKALLAFQTDPPPVHLDATNPHFRSKYASLGGVVAAIRPALTKHGLVYTQPPTLTPEGAPALETRLIHAESGEELSSVMPLTAEKPGPQAQGSALTYARRYALLSILGLVGDEDDDANAAPPSGAVRTTTASGSENGGAAAGVAHGAGQDASAAASPQVGDARDPVIHFSKNSGKRLSELTPKQLEWYAQTWEPNPQYANEADRALKEAAVAMHLGVPAGAVVGAPNHDDDIPFGPSIA